MVEELLGNSRSNNSFTSRAIKAGAATPSQGSSFIEGCICINRGNGQWVKKYCKVENSVFAYKKDSQMRGNIELRSARVRYSNSSKNESQGSQSNYESFIQISNQTETLTLAFDDVLEFENWKRVLMLCQRQTLQQQLSIDQTINRNQDLIIQNSQAYANSKNQMTQSNSKFKNSYHAHMS